MNAKRQNISRRTVLRGIGATVALPMFEAMAHGSTAIAKLPAEAAVPQRMAFFYVPNGMHMSDWTPAKTGSDFELPKILQTFEPFREKLNVISNLTLNGARALGDGPGDHARSVAAFLTGAHPRKTSGRDIKNGISVDQMAAQAIGKQTRLPSLELGAEQSARAGRCDSGYSCIYTSNISWRNQNSPVAKEIDPAAVFDRLFGSHKDRLESKRNESRQTYRQSILDLVQEDAKKLSRELGTSDNRKLEEYLHAIREIELRIAKSKRLDKKELHVPDFPRPAGVPRDYEQHLKLLMDMLVLAFQTDSTRVATFMYANAGSNRPYRNLGIRGGHHSISHHGNNKKKQEQISQINQYHASIFSYFLKRLDSIRESNGKTLLDNSMIMYGSGIADGNRHDHHALPIALFGSAQGKIKTGRHLKVKKETPLTNLYLTMLQQMKVKTESIGDSNGTIDALTG